MPKPWYTMTVMICSDKDKEQVGVGIRVQGPATRRGRFGPIVAELEETLDGTRSASEVLSETDHRSTSFSSEEASR